MANEVDLLQVKIEKAKELLPKETQRAIDSVAWKTIIMSMQEKWGFNVGQLADLATETELVLYGLTSGEQYGRVLESEMGISRGKAEALVEDMNELVFKKIREKLMAISEGNKEQKKPEEKESDVLKSVGIEIASEKKELPKIAEKEEKIESREEMLKKVENPVNTVAPVVQKTTPSILEQKFGGSFQTPSVRTEYSLGVLSKANEVSVKKVPTNTTLPGTDPYRAPIEE